MRQCPGGVAGPLTKLSIAVATSLLGLSLACGQARAQSAEDAVGRWLNPENGSNIEFYRCGDGLCAKLTKVTDGQATDDKNPDPAKRIPPDHRPRHHGHR